MFTHILVPLDGSLLAECVLPHLVTLWRAGSGQVTLLRVLDPSAGRQPVDPFDWQMRKAEAESYLSTVAERLLAIGLAAETAVTEGRAADTVLERAQALGVDLILLSSHGQSGLSGWNVSSVVQKIILRARRSVMIVRAYQPGAAELDDLRYARIMLPLDSSQRAEVALPFAAGLARHQGGAILAVHVVRSPEIPRWAPPDETDVQLAAQLTERIRVEAERYFESLAARLDAPLETRLLVESNPAAALYRLVESEAVDLVVMSAHGYSGDDHVPYGSTVISFIAYGTAPLLVIQDFPPEMMRFSPAELAAQEKGRV